MTVPAPRGVLPGMLALMVVAIALRSPRLTESLWYDEIAAWRVTGARGPGAIVGEYLEPSNHIAHTLLSWCSVTALDGLIGFEPALRLPALLFSLLGIWAMWGLAREVLGERGGWIAAGLAAVLPVAVLEVEARGYSMMICAAALASWTLLVNLRDERWWRWALYAVICALGTWTHFVTAFVPIGHAAWFAWRAARRREWAPALRAWSAQAAAAVLTIGLYAPALSDLLAQRGVYTGAQQKLAVFGPEGWHALLQLGGSWYAWAALPGLALAVVGLAWRRPPPPGGAPAHRLGDAAAITLLGLPLLGVMVMVAGSWMYARFALFAVPGGILLMAAGIDRVWTWRRAAGLAAAAVVAGVSLADLAVRPPKQPLRDAAVYVRNHLGPDDRVLIVGLAHQVMDAYMLDLEPGWSLLHGIDLERQLDALHPTWVIVYYPERFTDDRRAMLADRGFELDQRFRGWVDWTNGDVLVWRR